MASRFFGSIRQRVLFLFVSIVLIITVTILATVGILSRSLVKNLLEQNATSITQSYARSIHTWRERESGNDSNRQHGYSQKGQLGRD